MGNSCRPERWSLRLTNGWRTYLTLGLGIEWEILVVVLLVFQVPLVVPLGVLFLVFQELVVDRLILRRCIILVPPQLLIADEGQARRAQLTEGQAMWGYAAGPVGTGHW